MNADFGADFADPVCGEISVEICVNQRAIRTANEGWVRRGAEMELVGL
jgi:hypothetical protein